MRYKNILNRRLDDDGNRILELYEGDLNELMAELDALKNDLVLAQASLRACYNASAGALNLATSDRQPNIEGKEGHE